MNDVLTRPATKRVLLACIAVLLFAGVVAVATHSSEGIGDARLRTKGHATITSASGGRRTVTGTVALHRGDVVEIVDGEMTIDLPNGATVEGRTGDKGNDATSVKIAQPIELQAGDIAVLPAGTGHQRLFGSNDFSVIGGYPPEGIYNLCRGSNPADRDMALTTLSKVPLPQSDPVHGKNGPLTEMWR